MCCRGRVNTNVFMKQICSSLYNYIYTINNHKNSLTISYSNFKMGDNTWNISSHCLSHRMNISSKTIFRYLFLGFHCFDQSFFSPFLKHRWELSFDQFLWKSCRIFSESLKLYFSQLSSFFFNQKLLIYDFGRIVSQSSSIHKLQF